MNRFFLKNSIFFGDNNDNIMPNIEDFYLTRRDKDDEG